MQLRALRPLEAGKAANYLTRVIHDDASPFDLALHLVIHTNETVDGRRWERAWVWDIGKQKDGAYDA
jgi:hypothetical protein